MRKLYIPASTFNFNNILSSESISPKAFYEQRGFGHSRWLAIPENNVDNAIILCDKPIGFTRSDGEVEGHLMLIEIYTDEDFPRAADGMFYSDHTIYLSPLRTRFIFFSEQDKRIALLLADNSIETKLTGLYMNRICVERPIETTIPKIQLSVDLNREGIEHDYRINKLKGLLYGYYIGALLSTTPETTRKVNQLRELQDIFQSVLSSEGRTPTAFQNERLDFLLTRLQEEIPLISYMRTKLRLTSKNIERCVKLGMSYPDRIDKEKIIRSLGYSPEDANHPALNWLRSQQVALDRQIRMDRKPLRPSDEEIIVAESRLSKISDELLREKTENNLMIAWVNEVLLSKKYNGKISFSKEKIYDEIATKAKEIYQAEWGRSKTRRSLNRMRKHMRGEDNTFQWDDLLISSIAAVIENGNDWERSLAFMQSKSISDYRLAFAFYGELNGFANLTRDFTDHLLNISDREYVMNVYKELYTQLLGMNPDL